MIAVTLLAGCANKNLSIATGIPVPGPTPTIQSVGGAEFVSSGVSVTTIPSGYSVNAAAGEIVPQLMQKTANGYTAYSTVEGVEISQ